MSNGLTRDTGQEGRDLPAAATENKVEVDTLEAATSTSLDESVLIENGYLLESGQGDLHEAAQTRAGQGGSGYNCCCANHYCV